MNRIIRAFAAFIVSICLILAPAISYAASSWTMNSISMSGATAYINAAKTGFRSAITHAPSAASVGRTIVGGGGVVAVAYVASQLVDAGLTWVMTSGGDIKYTIPAVPGKEVTGEYIWKATGYGTTVTGTSREDVAAKFCNAVGAARMVLVDTPNFNCYDSAGKWTHSVSATQSQAPPTYTPEIPAQEKTIPAATVAAKVVSNAAAGHVPSQNTVKAAATADFQSGSLDSEIEAKATPSTDPVDPTDPSVPFDSSSIIAALQSLMSAVTNMSASIKAKMETMLTELGLMQQETNQVINDGMADVVAANQATEAKVGDVVAAIEALEGNTLDGQVINDAVDRAIAAGDVNAADIVAAIEGLEGNTLDGQVINDAVDRVIANDNANAQSAADAATAAADAAKAADADNTAAVTDAIGAQTDAITEADPVTGEMSLKFPKFCSWALPVCTFTDWAMADPQLEEPEDTRPEIQDLTKYDTVDISQKYITASGQCPPAADLNINFGVVKLSYEPLCIILDKLSGVIVAVAYISVGFMIIRTV